MGGYTYAGDNPTTSSDPSGLSSNVRLVGGGDAVPWQQIDGCGGERCVGGGLTKALEGAAAAVGDSLFGDLYNTATHVGSDLHNSWADTINSGMPPGSTYVPHTDPPDDNHPFADLTHTDPTTEFYKTWHFGGSVAALGTATLDVFKAVSLATDAVKAVRALSAAADAAKAAEAAQAAADAARAVRAVGDGPSDAAASSPLAGACSFSADTPVMMDDGTSKPIGDIQTGDKVQAADPQTGDHQGAKTVTATYVKQDNDLVDVTVGNSDGRTATLHTTDNHPFWDLTDHSWVLAGNLVVGHALETESGSSVHITAVRTVSGTADRISLTVDQLHTYYVLAGTTPVLVHNCDGDVDPQSAPGGKNGAAVSIKQVKMALGRAGMSVSDYDIVHVPEISTAGDGLPAYGNSPHDGSGMPNLGPRGRPVIQISNMGLADMDTAVATIFHEIYHHQMYATWPSSMGGTESAAEIYGQAMLGIFTRRTG